MSTQKQSEKPAESQSESDNNGFAIENVVIVADNKKNRDHRSSGNSSGSQGRVRSGYEEQQFSDEQALAYQNYAAYAQQQQQYLNYQQQQEQYQQYQQQAAAYYASQGYQGYTGQPGYPSQAGYGSTNQQKYAPWPAAAAGDPQNTLYMLQQQQQQPQPQQAYSMQTQQSTAPPQSHQATKARRRGSGRSTSSSSPLTSPIFGTKQAQDPYSSSSGGEEAAAYYAALLQGTGRGQPANYGAVQNKPPPKQVRTPQQQGTETSSNLGRPTTSRSSSPTDYLVPVPPPPPPRQPPKPHHRRSQSDSLAKKSHRRTSSDKMRRGVAAGRLPTDPLRSRKTFDHQRSKSLGKLSPRITPGKATHRRTSSNISQISMMSEASLVSHVTDIRKSTFFRGVDEETGEAKLNFPTAFVHLLPLNQEHLPDLHPGYQLTRQSASGFLDGYLLERGHLYKVPIDDEEFEVYHHVAEDASSPSWIGDYDYMDVPGSERRCRCDCTNCIVCTQKTGGSLPPNYYCLAVEDNIYRRVVDEICASYSMPCGLFFCGHHEDVSRPSIFLAVTVILLLFGAMGVVAYMMRG